VNPSVGQLRSSDVSRRCVGAEDRDRMDGARDRGNDHRTDMRHTAIGVAADRACDDLISAGVCP
jgi:hypothetical protein